MAKKGTPAPDIPERLSDHRNFQDLLMQASVGIATFSGPEFTVDMMNDACLRMTDRDAIDIIGKPLFTALPEISETLQAVFKSVYQTGRTFQTEEYLVPMRRMGRTENCYFNFTVKALYDAANVVDGISVVVTEVTSHVENRHQFAESEKAFRRMVTQSPIAMTIFRGPEFIIEMANPAMLQNIWRKKHYEVLGKKALEVFPELNDQKYPAFLREVLRTGRIHKESESLAYIQGNDGFRKFYLDYEYTPLYEPDNSISGLLITVTDVTNKVEDRQRLEDAEARLRMAMEGTGLATWDLDLRNMSIIYSPRLNEIFGHGISKEVTHAQMRAQVLEEDLEKIVLPAFQRALETGVYDYEARILRPDQTICWIRTQGRVIFDDDKQPLRMLGTLRDITIQRNIQRSLEESENRLNIAVDSAELGTWELRLKTSTPIFSRRYLEILGFSEDERPTHAELLRRIHPDDVELRNVATSEALRTGHLDHELRIIPFGDTRVRWIRARGKVFYDDEGKPERMLGTVMDITPQKLALERVKESEERFRIIANTAPVMIWMSGDDKFYDFFNTSWLNFTGRKIEEEIGDGWLQNVYPDDVEACKQNYSRAFAAQKGFYLEYRLRRYDGQYRWISDNAVPRYDTSGHFIGFISACMDIDDAKRFNQRLQASELLFKTITNVAPVALWMTNERGENNYVNDTWISWTGIPLREQFNNGWLRPLIEADREVTTRVFRAKAIGREKFAAEFRFRRADGSLRWALSEGFPYYDNDGVFAGYAGSVVDITERKQDELLKNEFFAVASHELKTPITSIKAYTQLLASTYAESTDGFLKNALTKVENQVNKMSKLVADFLNLSKIESDKFRPVKTPFLLNELVAEVISDIQMVSTNHDILAVQAEPVTVEADREKIFQVITNFLTNAVKYSPGQREIKVEINRYPGGVEVSVADTGIGISESEHDKIFQRFYRAGSNNIKFSGFGIGLYISAEILRMHDGEIGVASEEGKGSRFYFKLPVRDH